MGVRRWSSGLVWLLPLLCLFAEGGRTDDHGKFAISQVSVRKQVITVYLDILDQSGQPLSNLAVSEISATLQSQSLKVNRVTPFDASEEGVACLFLIDVSKSITPMQFRESRQFTKDWINNLSPADRVALGTFGDDNRQITGFTADKGRLESALAALKPGDRKTKLYLAVENAASVRDRSNEGFTGRRVAVVLSDGLDEGSDVTEGELVRVLRESHVPVYTIGSSHLRPPDRQKGLEALHQIADASGGMFVDASAEPRATIEKELNEAIRRVFVVSLSCARCQPSGETHALEISFRRGANLSTTRFDLALMVPPPPSRPPPRPWWKQPWAEAALIVLIIALIILAVRRALREKPKTEEHGKAGPMLSRSVRPEPGPLPASGIPLRFTTVAGKQPGREYSVSLLGRVVVGRDQECELALPEDTEVSGRHCELTVDGSAVELTDLKSKNGTFLNGARLVARQRLGSGDLIRMGRTELRVTLGKPE